MQLLIATGNPGKRREFEVLLGELLPEGTRVFDLASWPEELDEVVEDGETFRDNAFKKAFQIARETGCTTLADDSGLAVDALDGAPGVYSARYAGQAATDDDNNRKLVRELAGVPLEERTARYVAVLCLVLTDDELGRYLRGRLDQNGDAEPDGEGSVEGRTVVFAEATCEGRIVDEPRGEGGFGYDPHFWVDDWQKTMAEVPLQKKNERSHRAAAVRKLAEVFSE
jgi:XTP/dITP diphosphohydrolase